MAEFGPKLPTTVKIAIAGVIALIAFALLAPFTIVGPGERAVIVKLGKVDRVLSEGVHWVTPIIEGVKSFDVRVRKTDATATAASKDLQTVRAEIVLNWSLIPEFVGQLYQAIGTDFEARVIVPSLQESVKAATARYTAEELITKREQVKDDIKTLLAERLSKSFIAVTDVNIVNFDFSESFNAAIEAKVTAEQNALAAKNKLEQVKYEATQAIEKARGEAESIRVQAEALKSNPALVNLKAVERWNGVLPSYVMGDSVPFINIR